MVWSQRERRDFTTRIEILEVVPEPEWGEGSLPATSQTGPPDEDAPDLDAECLFI